MNNWSRIRHMDRPMHGNTAIKCWKHANVAEFKEITVREMKYCYDHQIKINENIRYLSSVEKTNSVAAILNGNTDYTEDDVTYVINDAGFRSNCQINQDSSLTLGVFGCSFTFGVGMPAQDIYPYLFGNHLGCIVHNYGVPGGGIDRATRYYSHVSKYQKFDYVIFLVPHTGRMELPKIGGFDEVYSLNVIPNWVSTNKTDKEQAERIYAALDDNFFEFTTLKNIDQCVGIAKAHNTKIYFSSWDIPTYDLLYDYLGEDSGMLLPEFTTEWNNNQTKRARDGVHPGPRAHQDFFNRSLPYLK